MKEFILRIAEEAGRMAVEELEELKVSLKAPKSVVTQADRAVEEYVIGQIEEKYPGHNIIAEESDDRLRDSNSTWYIDPIDGTANYAHKDPHFAVSIAYAQDNVLRFACVNIPMMGMMYFAEKGKGAYLNGKKISVSDIARFDEALIQLGISPLRSSIKKSLDLFSYFMLNAERARDYGFCAGQLAFVSDGKSDGLVKMSQHPWDIAAGILLITEAGGKVTDERGKDFVMDKKRYNIVASNGKIHGRLIDNLKTIKIEKNWYR